MSGAPPPMPAVPISQRSRNLGVDFVASSTVLCAVAVITLGWRIYVKVRPRVRLGLDDYFLLLGSAFAITDWIILIIPLAAFVGPHPVQMMPLTQVAFGYRLAFFGILVWSFAMACIKTSIAFTLMRFLTGKGWRWFLYSMIAIQVLMVVANTLFLLLQCRPVTMAWNLWAPKGTCLDPGKVRIASTTTAAVNIATDVLLSVVPLSFLMRLHRPLRERVLLIVLMATGIMASIASILKTTIVLQYGSPKVDPMDLNISIPTWTCAEEFIGIIAACLPCLKLPIQRFLALCGFSMGWDSERGSSGSSWATGGGRPRGSRHQQPAKLNSETGTEEKAHSSIDRSDLQRDKIPGSRDAIMSAHSMAMPSPAVTRDAKPSFATHDYDDDDSKRWGSADTAVSREKVSPV